MDPFLDEGYILELDILIIMSVMENTESFYPRDCSMQLAYITLFNTKRSYILPLAPFCKHESKETREEEARPRLEGIR